MNDGPRSFQFDTFLQRQQLGCLWGHHVDFIHGFGQQARAHGTDGACGPDYHRLTRHFAALTNTHAADFFGGIVGGPERAGGTVAVTRGDR